VNSLLTVCACSVWRTSIEAAYVGKREAGYRGTIGERLLVPILAKFGYDQRARGVQCPARPDRGSSPEGLQPDEKDPEFGPFLPCPEHGEPCVRSLNPIVAPIHRVYWL
jgi:hypothetical protein